MIRANNLNLCLECGKCSSVCPMLVLYGNYNYDRSPRGVVERMSLNDPGTLDDETFWYCLTCQECSFYCPSGVDFQNFMMALREILIAQGLKKFAVFRIFLFLINKQRVSLFFTYLLNYSFFYCFFRIR